MKIPQPEHRRALLYSDSAGRPTRHTYVGTKACIAEGVGGGPAWEHIFECEITGARRRFGVEDRRAHSWEKENN